MTGRRLAWVLWPVLLVYVGLVAARAYDELTDDYTVKGLFRTYLPPQTLPIGWLFDARTGSLPAEIAARYGVEATPIDDSIAAWEEALRARGMSPRRVAGAGEGAPRLVFVKGGPWLITGQTERRPIAFDPQRGMLLLQDGYVDPRTPALAWQSP